MMHKRSFRPTDHRAVVRRACLTALFARGLALATAGAGVVTIAACAPPPPSGPPTQAQIQAFGRQADGLMRSIRACDRAAQHAVGSSGSTSYDGSLNAEGECEKTANTLVNFRFSEDIGLQFQNPLNGAVAGCWSAYDAKARGMAKLAQSANAETAPEVGPLPDFGQIDVKAKACVDGLDKAARAQGFKAGVAALGD
jgi:hypothetical protein